MTWRWHSARHRQGRLRAELQRGLAPIARPNPAVLVWRWRYELALLGGIPAAITALIAQLGTPWGLATVSAMAAIFSTWPEAHLWLLDHAWCVITAHRVRTGCAQAWIHSRYGKLPIILLTSPKPFGERVYLWCRAGTCLADFKAGTDILRATCWAQDIHVTTSARHSHIVILDVVRREITI